MKPATLIRQYLRENPEAPSREAAEEVLDLLLDIQIRDCALQYLIGLSNTMERVTTKNAIRDHAGVGKATSRSSFSGGATTTTSTTTTTKSNRTDESRELLNRPVTVPGVAGVMRYGDMTVSQHRAVIGVCERAIGGYNRTIAAHQSAIDEIVSAGVTCLREVMGESMVGTKP